MAALEARWEVTFSLRFRHVITARTAGDVRRIAIELAENPTVAVSNGNIVDCYWDEVWRVKDGKAAKSRQHHGPLHPRPKRAAD